MNRAERNLDIQMISESEPDAGDVEEIARQFHETYELLAPSFGYETRRESAVDWRDIPEANRQLMIATCRTVLARLSAARQPASEPDAGLRKRHEATSNYAIALQRAIERHCRGLEVPANIAAECPHHAEMLNAARSVPASPASEPTLTLAMKALRDIRDDWDCDEDAHKYNTTCRACMAADVLRRLSVTTESTEGNGK